MLGGNDSDWQVRIAYLLDNIKNTGIGAELLTKINNNPNANKVWIGKHTGDRTNITQNEIREVDKVNDPFFLLRTLFRFQSEEPGESAHRRALAAEMTTALAAAAGRGRSLARLAAYIARYSSIATFAATTARNKRLIKKADKKADRNDELRDPIEGLLRAMCDADAEWGIHPDELLPGNGQYSLGDMILRALHRDLTPGPGVTTKIMFNIDIDESCVGDGKMEKRPPIVGLFHELVHAYRNVRGQRLFDDFMSCNLPDDELMTTGITPYGYVHFTENKFRGAMGVVSRDGYR